jgi:hypothetical protein
LISFSRDIENATLGQICATAAASDYQDTTIAKSYKKSVKRGHHKETAEKGNNRLPQVSFSQVKKLQKDMCDLVEQLKNCPNDQKIAKAMQQILLKQQELIDKLDRQYRIDK